VTVALNTAAQPVGADVDLTNDTSSDEVATCLHHKIQAVEPGPIGTVMQFVTPLYFIHSGVSESLMSSPPSIQYAQLHSLQHQRAADVVTREGTRSEMAIRYQALVKKAKTSRKAVKPAELGEACTELVKADASWLSALSRQLEVQEETVSLASELKEKDSGWAQVEKSARPALSSIQAAYEKAKTVRNEDSAQCTKERPPSEG
jgi:hypothetical protein